jgi:hypothetical protein
MKLIKLLLILNDKKETETLEVKFNIHMYLSSSNIVFSKKNHADVWYISGELVMKRTSFVTYGAAGGGTSGRLPGSQLYFPKHGFRSPWRCPEGKGLPTSFWWIRPPVS